MSGSIPTPEIILAFAAGELTLADAESVARYVSENAAAAKTVEMYRAAALAVRSDDSVAPPADVIARARELFATRRVAKSESLLDQLRRVVAELVFDSRPRLALAGVRGSSGSFQLSFESDVADVDLQVEATVIDGAQRWRMIGQVTPRGTATVLTVALSTHNAFTPIAATAPDEHGAFSLDVRTGNFDLLISVSDAVVVLPGVEIK